MKINQNSNFGVHNTTRRDGRIEYICIHYVGATGGAKANVNYYNQPSVTSASADFFVGHTGDIWQYNPDLNARYCWAVGSNKKPTQGGSFYGKCRNRNSISIEMCVKNKGNKTANHRDWWFTEETIAATIEITKHLMKLYNIPAERVIRHYDVTGKLCPGVYGWNPPSGSEALWNEFKRKIGGKAETNITTGSTASKGGNTVTIELPILKVGSKGASVKTLQQLLNAKGYSCGTADGDFGAKTLSAVKKFQATAKLSTDGICGKDSWTALLTK